MCIKLCNKKGDMFGCKTNELILSRVFMCVCFCVNACSMDYTKIEKERKMINFLNVDNLISFSILLPSPKHDPIINMVIIYFVIFSRYLCIS